jgi:N,N'-diacetyllegionaminate synthase
MKIIAEIGWNHMGDMSLADEMISAASDSGANVVKFQYWNPKYLKPGEWDQDGRREIYNKACLDEKKIQSLIDASSRYNCDFLISAFGTKGAEKINMLGEKSIKIPSHETTNIKLLEYCAENFNEILFSAGACTEGEARKAIDILEKGSAKYTLMHCVSAYPCGEDRINLKRINWLKTFNTDIGLSDHTLSTVVPALAVTFGVSVIEKHFTIDHDLPGRDNKFALEPKEFSEMVKNIEVAIKSMIDHGIDYQDIESDTVNNYRGRWESHDYES